MTNSADKCHQRLETDSLGERKIRQTDLTGIHTSRAMENFPISQNRVHTGWFRALGVVKLAAAITNHGNGAWPEEKGRAIIKACKMVAGGELDQWNRTNALQGGAGTSLNMNVNEVITNQALVLLGHKPGDYDHVSPIDDANMHQSTNDTVPTALKVALLFSLEQLEASVIALQESCQRAETRFAHVVKIGRTQLQDAVLTTLGRTFGAFASMLSRDRWRIFKARERLRVINLGGTAIGSGIGAPRKYIELVADTLKELTSLPLTREDDLIDGTQNADALVEVSGILKTFAANLGKMSADLRQLASGPDSGFGEIRLPAVQAGSSIMPGKVNPVIPEAAQQTSVQFMARDTAIAMAAASGNLELSQFLPLIGDNLLRGIDELTAAAALLAERCIDGVEADEERCRQQVLNSTATLTALLPEVGYRAAERIADQAREKGISLREAAIELGIIEGERFDELISPANVLRLGWEETDG